MLKTMDLRRTAIDPARRKYRTLFEHLQGNIVKPRGRKHAALIFLRIRNGKAAGVRAWIRTFAATHVTSARRQFARPRLREPFGSLLLSAAGYRALGAGLRLPSDPKFRAGMKRSGGLLKDPDPRAWEAPYRGALHALVILGDDRLGRLNALTGRVRKDLQGLAAVVAVERGRQWKSAAGETVEHFGYADGLSQPQFLKKDIERLGRGREGTDVWDPSAPLRLVLVKDPNARAADAFGSYLVFRKLEQNVRAFMRQEREMTQALALPRATAGRAGALMVGRFPDGTPVMVTPGRGMTGARPARRRPVMTPTNNFTYEEDPKGSRCPVQAHIRAVNPRDRASLDHRIVRCGITYGERRTTRQSFTDRPARGVGLLFMCFQRDIGRQFEWAQRRANRPAGRLRDVVVGQGRVGAPQPWPPGYGQRIRVNYPHVSSPLGGRWQRSVTLRGGEYFFAPSLPFLKGL